MSSDNHTSQKVKDLIESNKVIVFAKSYCPYCKKTKETFEKGGVQFKLIDLDQIQDGNEMQNELLKLTG